MKLRSILVMGLLAISFSKLSAQSNGINWESFPNWKAVLKAAQESRRPIFLDLYATWCGPCKWMDNEVYTIDSIGDLFNKSFIRVKVQMDSLPFDDHSIKSWYDSAREIQNSYGVRSFPTLLFLSPDGDVYSKVEGVRNAPSLHNEAMDALDPSKQYITKFKLYESGHREPSFVRDFVRRTEWLGQRTLARKMAKEYINSLSDEEMLTQDNIWFIYENTKTSKDRGFNFFANYDKKIAQIEPKMGLKYTHSKLAVILSTEVIKPYGELTSKTIQDRLRPFGRAGDLVFDWIKPNLVFKEDMVPFFNKNPEWIAIQRKIDSYNFDITGTLSMYEKTMKYYASLFTKKRIHDNEILITAVTYYLTHPDVDLAGSNLANDFAWMAFEQFNDEASLKAALVWGKLAMGSSFMDPYAVDTYANLLYKLGRKEEALVYATIAAQKAPDDKEIQENLGKIKAGASNLKN